MKSLFVLAALVFTFGANAQAQNSFELSLDGFDSREGFGREDRGPGWSDGDGWRRNPDRGWDDRGPRRPDRDWDDRDPGRRPGWGRPDRPERGDQQLITCESGRRPNRCFVDGAIRDVRLMRQLSRAACVEGRTFGFDRDSIWVTDGCRGEFLVTASRHGGHFPRPRPEPRPDPRPRSELIECRSRGFGYASCPVRGVIEAVRIELQHSRNACIEGTSFSFERNYLWVDRGCEATFRVFYR